jgi:hypothetical protein
VLQVLQVPPHVLTKLEDDFKLLTVRRGWPYPTPWPCACSSRPLTTQFVRSSPGGMPSPRVRGAAVRVLPTKPNGKGRLEATEAREALAAGGALFLCKFVQVVNAV